MEGGGEVKLAIVSHHLPDPEGTAAGRVLHATVEGLLSEGHGARVRSWAPLADPGALPDWCEWTPLDARSPRRRSLLRPRDEASALAVEIGPEEVAVADDWLSFPAITRHHDPVLTLHHRSALDAAALGRRSPRAVQDHRAERRAIAGAARVLGYSPRVATSAGPRAIAVPIAVPIPDAVVTPVEAPVVALLADWRWPPNAWARDRLLDAWPHVRERVAGARLLLAGRGETAPGTRDGVERIGEVAWAVDVLSRAAVVAFPCPATSGPKVKVLEAMAAGVPVVTTPAGVEGIVDPDGVTIADLASFADAVVALLADRGDHAQRARAAVIRHHAPPVAVRARVGALSAE